MNAFALVLTVVPALLTVCGIAYSLLTLWGLRQFRRDAEAAQAAATPPAAMPGVSLLKPLRGLDPAMAAGFASHCRQRYPGPFEIVFGVSSLDDPAVAQVARLRVDFPEIAIKLVACRERLGPNGKLSSLAQMLPEATYEHLVVNDSDILVGPDYLLHVVRPFVAETDLGARPGSPAHLGAGVERPGSPAHLGAGVERPGSPAPLGAGVERPGSPAPLGAGVERPGSPAPLGAGVERPGSPAHLGAGVERPVGLVTVPYLGRAERTLPSKLEALGISTDFLPGVLAARALEGGLRFGLGSTLATTRSALAAIGGFEALTDQLADDYEMGARLHRAGYRVELVPEVVATTVPAYNWRGFAEHQLRWARSTRDSRRAGYLGLLVTYLLPWAVLTMVASGLALWSFTLFAVALLVRTLVALSIGVGLLRDGQVLRDILWLPLRDFCGLFFWAWSYASDLVVWRGERFRLHKGVLQPLAEKASRQAQARRPRSSVP